MGISGGRHRRINKQAINDNKQAINDNKQVINDNKQEINDNEQELNDNKQELNDNKQEIINLFNANIKDKKPVINGKRHDGSEGHWLERQMGIIANNKNEPDIFGYEMKKESKKITLGDFSASEYLFSLKKDNINKFNKWKEDNVIVKRDDFIKYFGSPNSKKHNRISWSGSCVPKYGVWNKFGQILVFNNNNDLCIYYSYERDTRDSKEEFPDILKVNSNVLIVIWKENKLAQCINRKFNSKGFFICKKINEKYEKICFGMPFNFEHFVENMKKSNIIFDSGMYRGNTRNYSQFRATNNKFWNNLITEEY